MAVTAGANPWGERGSYEAQEAFIAKWGYVVATRKAAEVDVILPPNNPWSVERWSPSTQATIIKQYGHEFAKRRAAQAGFDLPDPPPPPPEPYRPVIVTHPERPRVYIIKGRPGPKGDQGIPGAVIPLVIDGD